MHYFFAWNVRTIHSTYYWYCQRSFIKVWLAMTQWLGLCYYVYTIHIVPLYIAHLSGINSTKRVNGFLHEPNRVIYRVHPSNYMHQMDTIYALLALCAGNSPVTGEFPSQRPVTRSFDVPLFCAWINGWVKIVRLVIWDAITLIMMSL